MDQLWAPWRLAYVAAPRKPAEADACFICQGLAETDDRKNLIALRTPGSVVVLNRFPYNNGHLLIAPQAHKGTLAQLDSAEMLETMETVRRMTALLDQILHPDGYNIGLNQGAAAGAGLPGHLHWHIVPRWNGDTNFMPVIGETKVISQHLLTTYDRLLAAFRG
jgi:ATP adenylyltransferase